MNDQFFSKTVELFKEFEEVDAVVLGGSAVSGKQDEHSDFDLYVYLNNDLCVEKRKNALEQTCKYMELNNTYFETEDDCIMKNGVPLEIIYRWVDDICNNHLSSTLEKHIACNGYTTCVCYNVFNSKILYDPKEIFDGMIKRFTMPYPEPLRKNIISKNREFLEGKIPSYFGQIEKAIKRNDIVSINHRVAEFTKTYFDILFALNRKFHPGEKRIIRFALDLCKWLPVDFEADFNDLFSMTENEKIPLILRKLVLNLDDLITKYV